LRADGLLGVARQLRQEGQHAASTEVEEPRPFRLDGDTCHLVVHRPDLALELRDWSAPNTFVDAATYSSGTLLTMSTLASPRTRSAFASVGVSPTSIVIATFGRDDSAFTLGAVAAVQTAISFPFQ
jgi:hypothetical protein